MTKQFYSNKDDAKMPSRKESLFWELMQMNEELGRFHNDYFERCLLEMQHIDVSLGQLEPLEILKSVASHFSPYDEFVYLNEYGKFESLDRQEAIDYMLERKDAIEKEFLSNLDPQIAHHWFLILEDDETSTGGTAHEGETLGDFLLGNYDYINNSYDDMIDLDLDSLNEELKFNGIKIIDREENLNDSKITK